MNIVGLPGEFGLVWAATIITNIYGGLIVIFTLSINNSYSVAQITVLGTMMLIAHTFPIELQIAKKAGARIWFMFLLRFLGAFILGWIMNYIFTFFKLYSTPSKILWSPGIINPSLLEWVINECKNYLMIFLIILSLMLLIRILKITGVLDKLNNLLEPFLELLGMSKKVAPITIIGMTLGLSYGGGLIINQSRSHLIDKKDTFLSLSFMGLSHSLIEDTLLMIAIGATLSGILFGRLIFTIIVMLIIIRIIKYLSDETFNKYFIIKNNK
jgi:spore maturation protein SpmB